MAIDLTLESSLTSVGTSTNTTITKPTNTVDDDFLIAFIHVEDDVTVTAPSGWTLITSFDSTGEDMTGKIYYKRASSEGSDWTWTHNSTWSGGWVQRLTGVATSGDPEDATLSTNEATTGATVTWTGITTATDGALIFGFGGAWVGSGQAWSASTLTERMDDGEIAAFSDIQTSAGASGNKVATLAHTSADWYAILIALKPVTSDPQTLTGTSAFAPSLDFPTGVIAGPITGVAAFTPGLTFATGSVNLTVTGSAAFAPALDFPTGQINLTVTGAAAFTPALDFPTGQLNLTITGAAAFTPALDFPTGTATLAGGPTVNLFVRRSRRAHVG